MKKRYKIVLGISALLVAGYFLGPKPKKPIYNQELTQVPDLEDLDHYVATIESRHK